MIKQISLLSFGGLLVTLLQLVLYPIFATRVGATVLGDYGYILSIIQTASILSLLNTHLLIRVESDWNSINSALNTGVTLVAIISVPIGVLFAGYSFGVRFISVFIFIAIGLKNLYLSLLYNEEKYGTITIINILNKITLLVVLITVVYLFHFELSSLLLSFFAVEVFTILLIIINISKNIQLPRFSFKRIFFTQNKDLIGFKTIQDLINKLGGQLPIIFAKNFIDSNTAGNYFLALRMVQSPLSILSKAIREVVFVEYGKLKGLIESRFSKRFLYIHIVITFVIFTFLGLAYKYGYNLIPVEWIGAFQFLFFITPVIISNSSSSIFRDSLIIQGYGSFILKLDVCFGLIRFLLFIISWRLGFDFSSYLFLLMMCTIFLNIIPVVRYRWLFK